MISKRLHLHDNLDPWLTSHGAFLTQGEAFATWQQSMGRKVIREIISATGEAIYYQIFKYPLPFGQSYLYIPHGPVVSNGASPALWQEFKKRAQLICREEGAAFIRFDIFPAERMPDDSERLFKSAPISSYLTAFFQPQYEWLIDLTDNLENILSSFSKKTRYAIRVAGERGIEVEIITHQLANQTDLFYGLLTETAKRNDFSLHNKTYYHNILQITEARGDGFLVVAKKDGEPLVANLVHLFGHRALFVFSGSAAKERSTNATYLAQWETIKELKKRKITSYSLGGISPDEKKYPGWSGIGKFKRNFTGQMFSFSPFFDIVNKPLWYYLYLLRRSLKRLSLKS